MAGKDPVFVQGILSSTMDTLSKNQLIDLVAQVAYRQLGEDASDEEVIHWLQPKLNVVWERRGDKKVDLQRTYKRREIANQKYQDQMRRAGKL